MKLVKEFEKTRVVFHYNKAHNADRDIPVWVVKAKGETWYVDHMDSDIGFSTKETPDSAHTKGSIQFKGKLSIYSDGNGRHTAKVRKGVTTLPS